MSVVQYHRAARPFLFALAIAMTATPAMAQTATGIIEVALTVTNACVINDATEVSTDLGEVGRIDFTDQPGTFTSVDGELVTRTGQFSVRCSPGATPVLTIGAGTNDDAGTRRMTFGAATIPYQLFTSPARDDEIAIGRQIALGTAETAPLVVPIFARATNPAGVISAAGTYTDTVSVTLSW